MDANKIKIRAEKEYCCTINEVENALKQLKYGFEAFQRGDLEEKAFRLSNAISTLRKLNAHIDLGCLGVLAARLDIAAETEANAA